MIQELPVSSGGELSLPAGKAVWASAPIIPVAGKGKTTTRPLAGVVCVEVPALAWSSGGLAASRPLVEAGAGALALSIPAGIAFGLLSTRRLKRLARFTRPAPDGQSGEPIPVSGTDEFAQLEDNFNRTAARLSASPEAERQLAAANARYQERSRIARESHDSITQELFSLSVLSGGLRRSLPPALDGICRAHRERLGIDVQAEIADLTLPAPIEHTILRVAQEAIGHAIKHARAGAIRLRLTTAGGQVVLTVSDDGKGFDPDAGSGTGLGLRAMRERVAELGGSLRIDTGLEHGTVLQAAIPVAPAAGFMAGPHPGRHLRLAAPHRPAGPGTRPVTWHTRFCEHRAHGPFAVVLP